MNDVIFDWEENCEKILNGEGYTSNRRQGFEQAMLFKYMSDQGYTKDEIYEFWKTTDSKTVEAMIDDEEELVYSFEKLWERSKKCTFPPKREIVLFQEELDFINSMITVEWVKQYILTVLCIYKYVNLPWCPFDSQFRRFCFSVTTMGREKEDRQYLLQDCLTKYKPYQMMIYNGTLSIKTLFSKKEGIVVATIRNPRHVQDLFGLIKMERVCEQCGGKYNYNYKNIGNTMCPSCFKKHRYQEQSKCRRRRVNTQRSNSI